MSNDIRLAAHDDIPELEDLIKLSVRKLSVGFYAPEAIERALVSVFGVDTQLIVDRTYYVAEASAKIVGCGGWSRRKTLYGGDQSKLAEDSLLDPQSEAARIRAFFVHPDHARQGIGRRILHLCEQAALDRGFKNAELVATLPGEPMYAALGYAPIESLIIDVGEGDSIEAVRMVKSLDQNLFQDFMNPS